MTPQIISLGRNKYAVGLFWQPLGVGRSASADAAKIAKVAPQGKFRYYAEYRNLVGLGSDVLKHRAGMFALAPEVVESLGDVSLFAAAFRVVGGIWIVAVRNGLILADQDRFFEDEGAARAAFLKLTELPDWSKIYAPSDWQIPGAEERDLTEIISGRVKCALRPISGGSSLLKVLVVSAVAVGALWLFRNDLANFLGDKTQVAAPELTLEQVAAFREQMAAKSKTKPLPAPTAVMPWSDIPDAAELSAKCFNAIAYVMQPIYGWNITSAECKNGAVSAVAARSFGTLLDLENTTKSLMPGIELKLSGAAGQSAELTGFFAKTPGKVSTPDMFIDEIERSVRSSFQQAGMNVDISRGREVLKAASDTEKMAAEYVLVRADSKIMPSEFASFFENLKAVEILSIRWDAVQNQWSYEEKIYAK